jgi:hypothetical protein
MIVVDIIQNNEVLAVEISKYLITENYALQTHIDTNTIIYDTSEYKTVRLFFITKSLLFDIIEKDILKKFGNNDLLIYATPVSHISQDFGEMLRMKLKAV